MLVSRLGRERAHALGSHEQRQAGAQQRPELLVVEQIVHVLTHTRDGRAIGVTSLQLADRLRSEVLELDAIGVSVLGGGLVGR